MKLRFSLTLLFLGVLSSKGRAYDISAARPGVSALSGPQFKDFANEWAFAAGPPPLGPTRDLAPGSVWVDLSHNIRSVRMAPGERGDLRLPQYAWIASPALARKVDSLVHIPFIEAGISLPGGTHAGLLYGRSPNVNLQVAGFELCYPFLRPSLKSPGLWARFSYLMPSLLPGLRMSLPAAGLYLTNEFLRTPSWGRPLRLSAHAGVNQSLVLAQPQSLPAPDGGHRRDNTFLASTQFVLGLEVSRHRWSVQGDAGYGSSESVFTSLVGGKPTDDRRVRAFWSQGYKISYRFN